MKYNKVQLKLQSLLLFTYMLIDSKANEYHEASTIYFS